MSAERMRLEAQRQGMANWRLWGPYLAERAWGTVREDYSPNGTAWEYFDHDAARSRVYRWSEDGLGGICDVEQRLCLALALWNGRDPILKERAFGLTGNQGNHGEDVKESYFYLGAIPSHGYLRYLYKYPQGAYPYAWLIEENGRRSRLEPTVSPLDSGAFRESRYWDVEAVYAKADPETILLRLSAHNRGPEAATLHLLPTLWFRNTWSWAEDAPKPRLRAVNPPEGASWAVMAEHPTLGTYHLVGSRPARLLFTENESNAERLWGLPSQTPYTKDAFHRRVIEEDEAAVNPAQEGTKFAAWTVLDLPAGGFGQVDLVLAAHGPEHPFKDFERVMVARRAEADAFHEEVLPEAAEEDAAILRQALSGLLWNQQFYHYDVARWLDGDRVPPPEGRKWGRNHGWRHLKAAQVVSMPDTWEYPWFASWDLAFHCAALTLVDVDLAKDQLELLLKEDYLHPNGQIPAYEWAFGDVNPPLQAWAALECFRAERDRGDRGDLAFLERVFHKLVLNYGWWLNRTDPDNRNVFEGGFLGLDNISVYDRSRGLPAGYRLKQADATGWMAMFALNLTAMALELACAEPASYEDMAIQIHAQFFAIAKAVHGYSEAGVSLWDPRDRFFKDVVVGPLGAFPLPVFSWVGLIPLFACEVTPPEMIARLPRYSAFLMEHGGGLYDGHFVCACPATVNTRGEHLFSLVEPANLPAILGRVLDEDEFLSAYGVRSLSRLHASGRHRGEIPGLGEATVAYEPGESESGLFGGNSNWRGPVWFPLNFLLVQSLDKFHRYLGETFRVSAPCLGGREVTLGQAADVIAERLLAIFRRDGRGLRPAFPKDSPFQDDPHWRDLLLFHEFFHAETGQGLGASHQTGWTALVANLLKRRHGRAE